MEQIKALRTTFLSYWNQYGGQYLSLGRNKYIEWVHFMGRGATETTSTIIGSIIALVVFTFAVGIPLHRCMIKNFTKLQQELVKHIDEILYLVAKYQYQFRLDKKALGGDPHFAMMNAMFQAGKFDYLDNIAMIKTNTQKVEQIFRNQIVNEEHWKEITKLEKKMIRKRKRNQRRGRLCTIPTLGIYKLFW